MEATLSRKEYIEELVRCRVALEELSAWEAVSDINGDIKDAPNMTRAELEEALDYWEREVRALVNVNNWD